MAGSADQVPLVELLRATAAGDESALQRVYERESARLYGVALRMVRNQATAADIIQDAFLQIWQKASSFDPERGNAEAWLISIVRYRALDILRRSHREVLSDDPNLGDANLGNENVGDDALEILSSQREGAKLRRCLATLDEKNRRMILLAFVDGLSHGDIAARTGTPLGTVKAGIRRGLGSLKGCLAS